MFRRLTTSLSNPRFVVFFMKDRVLTVLGYILFLPLFLVLPKVLSYSVNPGMDQSRYDLFYQAMVTEFPKTDAKIIDGTLLITSPITTTVEIFTLHLGNANLNQMTLNVVFSEKDLIFYIADYEQSRMSYAELGIENFDFGSQTKQEYHQIGFAIRTLLEKETIIRYFDLSIIYFVGLIDYIILAFFLTLMMLIFPLPYQIPMAYRLKISIYLMAIWVLVELFIKLFNTPYLSFLSVLAVYIYHVITYRFMRTLKVEVIHEKQ